jgi:ABC-type amino acid transport substrate-binding protein
MGKRVNGGTGTVQSRLRRAGLLAGIWLVMLFWLWDMPARAEPLAEGGSSMGRLTDIDRIQHQGQIEVALFFEDVPPFFMGDREDNLVGIDPELAKDIADKLGVVVRFNRQAQTFDALVDTVASGEADIAISLLSDTLNRALRVNFSKDYVVLRQTLLVNRLLLAQQFPEARSSEEIRDRLNRSGLKIGVIEGTAYVDFLKADYPMAENDFAERSQGHDRDRRQPPGQRTAHLAQPLPGQNSQRR